jgi:long-chain acyl-CoA synthetase
MMDMTATALLTGLPERISALATRWAEIAPDRPALVEASGMWRYSELPRIVDDTRAWLMDSGVRPGDRVMIVAGLSMRACPTARSIRSAISAARAA